MELKCATSFSPFPLSSFCDQHLTAVFGVRFFSTMQHAACNALIKQ